jgi:hypothetical protein
MYYDYPEEYDQIGVMEMEFMGKRVAWDEDDNVYIYTGDFREREDGYTLIGEMGWQDVPDVDPDRELADNLDRLWQFVKDRISN